MKPDTSLSEYEYNKLCDILRAFYQAERLHGTFLMKFGVQRLPDSDNEPVIDVYLTPLNAPAEASAPTVRSQHLQFLASMVPATASGFQYTVRIDDGGPELNIEILEAIPPVSS